MPSPPSRSDTGSSGFNALSESAATSGNPRVTPRSQAQVTRFFDGLELVEPGVVAIQQWRPDSDAEASSRAGMWGGVGTK